MVNEIAVVGYPSLVGGADTELAHQIELWLKMGLHVHLVPTDVLSDIQRAFNYQSRERVTVHAAKNWAALSGKHVLNFCSGTFLTELPKIRGLAKTTTFINCMTSAFDKEVVAVEKGLIDLLLYQTDHQQRMVSERLKGFASYRPMRFTPFFDASQFTFYESRPKDKFRIGRISRPDKSKYHPHQIDIYRAMVAPALKEVHIVGWCSGGWEQCGEIKDPWIKTYGANGLEQRAFYKLVDAVVMSTSTHENLPRVGMEAMASGSILVVDRRGGWTNLVEDGVTGWLCGDFREFVYKASRAAFEEKERAQMCQAARQRVQDLYGEQVARASWESVFAKLEDICR